MPPRKKVQAIHDLPYYVSQMDSGQKLCRGRRHHNWPSDYLGTGMTMKGRMRGEIQPAEPGQREGMYLITEWCIDCGLEGNWYTQPGGRYETDAAVIRHYGYAQHPNWVRVPKEVDSYPRLIKSITMGDEIIKMVTPPGGRSTRKR